MKGVDAGLADACGADEDGNDNALLGTHKCLGIASVVHAPNDGLTTPAPRFAADVEALLKLSKFDLPPLQVVWPSMVVHVYYGFRDASGKQFGATIWDNHNRKSTSGLRDKEYEDESSNFKELCNLVQTLTTEAQRLQRVASIRERQNPNVYTCWYSPFGYWRWNLVCRYT